MNRFCRKFKAPRNNRRNSVLKRHQPCGGRPRKAGFTVGIKITLGVLLLLLVLLLQRVRLRVTLSDEITLRAEYLFLSFRMNPAETGKAKKKEQPEPKAGGTVQFFLKNFDTIAGFVRRMARDLSGIVRVDRFTCDITVCSGDAAKTALTYGKTCAAVFGLAAFAENFVRFRRKKIIIRPDFTGEPGKTERVFFECVLSGVLINLVWATLKNGAGLLFSIVRKGKSAQSAPKPQAQVH